jgi:excisionase family DNA binding protein
MYQIVKFVRIVVPGLVVTEQLLTLSEAARRLGVSRKIVQTMVDHGQLPTVPVGDRVRIPIGAVEAYAELFDGAADLARRLGAELRKQQPPPDDQEARRS